VFFGNFIVKK